MSDELRLIMLQDFLNQNGFVFYETHFDNGKCQVYLTENQITVIMPTEKGDKYIPIPNSYYHLLGVLIHHDLLVYKTFYLRKARVLEKI